jgi:hypothetical protein
MLNPRQSAHVLSFARAAWWLLCGTIFGLITKLVVPDQVPAQAILYGAAGSLVCVGFVEAGMAVGKMALLVYRSYWLARLIGHCGVDGNIYVVLPAFTLSPEALAACHCAGVHEQSVFSKVQSAPGQPKTFRIDAPHLFAGNDMRAANILLEVFSQYTGKVPDIETDDHALGRNFSESTLVSIGFSSNRITHYHVEHSPKPLFCPNDDGLGSEYLRVIDVHGQCHDFLSTQNEQIAFVARWRPCREGGKDASHIFCAGVGPQGTVGAASFLARNLQHLARQFGEKDFVVVVKVPVESPDNAVHEADFVR